MAISSLIFLSLVLMFSEICQSQFMLFQKFVEISSVFSCQLCSVSYITLCKLNKLNKVVFFKTLFCIFERL